jgi:hypothetical protein
VREPWPPDLVGRPFFGGEQIQQEAGQTHAMQALGHQTIARARTTAAAAVGEKHNSPWLLWPIEGGLQRDPMGGELHGIAGWSRNHPVCHLSDRRELAT